MSGRYGAKRRVVQAYRRLDEDVGEDNPYPTVDSGARAIVAARPEPRETPVVTLPQGVTGAPTIPAEETGIGASRGQSFRTIDEAGRAALDAVNNWSRMTNSEYRWLIYRDGDGNYRYTPPQAGGLTGGADIHMSAPRPIVGMGHTHGNYSTKDGRIVPRFEDAFNSDDFSTGERDDDYGYMRKNPKGLDAFYLGTPSGNYYKWTPKGGKTRF